MACRPCAGSPSGTVRSLGDVIDDPVDPAFVATAFGWDGAVVGPGSGTTLAAAGGSRANFAELNRAQLPLHLLSAVAFAPNPQMHETDDESVMETLAALPVVIRYALRQAAGLPVVVGPVTLRPRFNAVATGPARPLPAGALPEDTDLRQATAFAAAWTLGTIARLAPTGAAALTYFETAGPKGLLTGASELPPGFPPPGAVYPVYYVLALLAPLVGRPVTATTSEDPQSVAVLAVSGRRGPIVAMANLRADTVVVEVPGDTGASSVLHLPSSPTAPGRSPEEKALGTPRLAGRGHRNLAITLNPWEVVALRIR